MMNSKACLSFFDPDLTEKQCLFFFFFHSIDKRVHDNHKRKQSFVVVSSYLCKRIFEQMGLRRVVLLIILLENALAIGWIARRANSNEDDEGLRYMVRLSEPLESTLEWDYYDKNKRQLILRWNITMNKGQAAILAFSTYDLETDGLDILLFRDDQLYNVFTDEESWISIPRNGIESSSMLKNSFCREMKRQFQCTIDIVRPLNTCDEQQRNYIIDRGTVQILTGVLSANDFQSIQKKRSIKMEIERMNLTLQRVQLLKPQVELFSLSLSLSLSLFRSDLIGIDVDFSRSISKVFLIVILILIISIKMFSFPMLKQRIGVHDLNYRHLL